MMLKVTGDGSATGTRITDDSGRDISKMVTGVRFTHHAGKPPSVEIDVMAPAAGFAGEGKAFLDGREVRRIIYADGGEEEF